MSVPNMLAKALYDNAAESPDELSFRKGDILTVLERDTQGLEGWWLCSLHGRQGIVPGNRLKVLVGMYDKQQQSPPSIAPNVLLVPQQGAYSKPHPSSQYTAMHPAPTPSLDSTYMLPPSHSKALPQDAYQVPTAAGGTNCDQDVYQTPSSSDNWNWTVPKPPVKVVVPTRVGQVYVYDTAKAEQDEYDVPRQFPSTQNIYDVPPTRNQKQQVYDTPSMAGKDTCRWGDAQDMYDTPAAMDKSHLQVYDVPPSVSKDTSESPGMGETYDVPPPFAKKKVIEDRLLQSHSSGPGTDPEEVYDVPPPLAVKRNVERSAPSGQEVYDIPSTCAPGLAQPQTDVYDVPRERGAREEESSNYVYDVPPQVVRDMAPGAPGAPGPSEEPCAALGTGSTHSSASGLSLDMVPSREPPDARADLEPAMERLSHLQQAVESSVSLLVALLSAGCHGSERTETGAVGMRLAAERAQTAVRDLLEFARVPVASSAQASDRTLQAKLSRQLQKMEQAYEGLVRHSQALERAGWTLGSASTVADDLEQLLACLRGVPDDTKQLGSFLHGNASLLFRRTKQPQLTGSAVPGYQASGPERARIQSRPLPSPPKFRAEEGRLEGTYETAEEGWMEDYDYVHLQGKEEFEKSQRQLLEKGNIIHHDKGQLEEQQLKQFERLEQEVTRPINNDPSGWTPPTECPAARSRLCLGDRQLLLFYLEQCESNVTALTNAVDAFFSSLGGNQPPKIFVAHSKFVILSAHKLVFIGDTLSRQAKSPEIRAQAAHHSATLCERLKDIVTSTKTAALQYPSPSAVRDTMDRVGELAACTQQFCLVLGQLATM